VSKRKWGESFLKTGLPLEYLVSSKFQSLEFRCSPHVEYSRLNRDKEEQWFELDLHAVSNKRNKETELTFLIECKYHDLSRFWFFLPYKMSRLASDSRILNPGPVNTLKNPKATSLLSLAPHSYGGIVVSEDGAKQDNAVHTAIQQLTNGFVPYALSIMFGENFELDEGQKYPMATTLVPLIVTNARIFRLQPDIDSLESIRDASEPLDVADEVSWTWCYNELSMALFEANSKAIEKYEEVINQLKEKHPFVVAKPYRLRTCPNWILVVTFSKLAEAVCRVAEEFDKSETLTVTEAIKRDEEEFQRYLAKIKMDTGGGK
jgi:hypothetical protein